MSGKFNKDIPRRMRRDHCPDCWRPADGCVCSMLHPVDIPFRLLILQHPQETFRPHSTARALSLCVPGSIHRIGLSWRSLKHALDGNPVLLARDPVLLARDPGLLGGNPVLAGNHVPDGLPAKQSTACRIPNDALKKRNGRWAVLYIDGPKKQAHGLNATSLLELDGFILLDGTYKNAKTLWWRNPWLRKLARIELKPGRASRIAWLRKAPSHRCLSTFESFSCVVSQMGAPHLEQLLLSNLDRIIDNT